MYNGLIVALLCQWHEHSSSIERKTRHHLPPSTSVCVDVGACNPVHSCMQRIYLGQYGLRRIACFSEVYFCFQTFCSTRTSCYHSHTFPFVFFGKHQYFELDKRDKFRFDNSMTKCSSAICGKSIFKHLFISKKCNRISPFFFINEKLIKL